MVISTRDLVGIQFIPSQCYVMCVAFVLFCLKYVACVLEGEPRCTKDNEISEIIARQLLLLMECSSSVDYDKWFPDWNSTLLQGYRL